MADQGRFSSGRHAGVLMPLFSIPSRRSWGIGEIPDLVPLARWLREAGLDFVQLLPVNEMQEGQSSPYSALSAMAIDPIFISLDNLEDWVGKRELEPADRETIARANGSPHVDYAAVRTVKNRALRRAFDWFADKEWKSDSTRSRAFKEFQARERWWVDDYTLFRALHDEHEGRYWREWDPGLRDRNPSALDAARARLEDRIRFYAYLQWVADDQWRRARHAISPIGIFGDFPFMVSGHSADVWARQQEFDVDASVGTPPDAFSADGQNWGLPAYRWDVFAQRNDEWLRQRTRRSVELFDGFRIDHLVGFYRTYVRHPERAPGFLPSDEPSQRAQGERLLSIFSEGATIIAEDLGTVPDFVRESLASRNIPGMKVLRWEREWHSEAKPFKEPASYPAVSVATSGTHDTETTAEWWDNADLDERRAVLDLSALRSAGLRPDAPFSDRTRDAMLDALFGAGSNLLILPFQDIFGTRDRVNTPGIVDDHNWTWRLPGHVEDLMEASHSRERAAAMRGLAQRHGRA